MRSAHWAFISVAILLSACGSGTDGEGGAGAGGSTTCGNGMVEQAAGEQCERSVAITQTCANLNMGTGVIMCNDMCQLVLMCTPNTPTGGTGAGGAGGR